jgi:acyl-CoA thioesterase I
MRHLRYSTIVAAWMSVVWLCVSPATPAGTAAPAAGNSAKSAEGKNPVCKLEPQGAKSRLIENLESGKRQCIVTYGTSLTAGGAWVRQLGDLLSARFPGKATVINSGKGAMWSKWGVDNLDEQVIKKHPDTVFIEFAINDAYLPYQMTVEQAQANLEDMIAHITAANPQCEIILMTMNPPTGTHLEKRPKFLDYYQMYRDVAKARHLLLIDHFVNWEKLRTQDLATFQAYVPDGIHPASVGCKKVIIPAMVRALGLKPAGHQGKAAGSQRHKFREDDDDQCDGCS